MKDMLLPEAKNDFLFTVIGDKTELIILFAALLIAAVLWRILKKK